jgi:hypothetical protein
MFSLLLLHPQIVLYAILASTYLVAANLSWRMGHGTLTLCYLATSSLYVLLCACNLMSID